MNKPGKPIGSIGSKNKEPSLEYSLTGEDLVRPVESIQVHKEFDKPRQTLSGAPSMAELAKREEKVKRIAGLLDQLKALSQTQDDEGWDETLNVASERLTEDEGPIQIQTISQKGEAREDDTLIMSVIDEETQKKDDWLRGIQEFAEEFQQKTGEIVLSKGNLDKIKFLIAKLKEMDAEERERKFAKIPLVVRKQILKIIAEEVVQKRANPKPPIEKKWPPITMTVTLGSKTRVKIERV